LFLQQTDFADGIVLIKLAEVLSGRTMPRYNKKANMRTQKLDNVSLVLNFFQKEEGIKIVNIGELIMKNWILFFPLQTAPTLLTRT